MSIFEQASRMKLRFETNKGEMTVEDLWDLPLTSARGVSLDSLYRNVNRHLKAEEEEGLIQKRSSASTIQTLQVDILKHIASVRQAENEEKRLKNANKERKDKIRSILARKEDEELENTSVEELHELLNNLED